MFMKSRFRWIKLRFPMEMKVVCTYCKEYSLNGIKNWVLGNMAAKFT